MLRFFQECEKYSGQITELSGPLDSCNYYTMAGMHGNHNIHTLNNQNEDLLLSLEKAQAMAAMLDRSFYSEPVDALWQDVLSCTGHAIEWCWKEDYAERMAQGRHTREKASRFLEDALCARSPAASPSRRTAERRWWCSISRAGRSAARSNSRSTAASKGSMLSDSDGKPSPAPVHGGRRRERPAGRVQRHGRARLRIQDVSIFARAKGDPPAAAIASEAATPARPAIENEFYRITVAAERPVGSVRQDARRRARLAANRRPGRFGHLRHAAAQRCLGARRPAGQTPRLAAGGRPVPASCKGPCSPRLTIPGKIGGHAITREVRLWRGSRRIEFGVDLNTTQRDNGIFCIRFPIGMSGKVVAGIPFGVESRDNLEKEPFRGESFCHRFSRRLRRHALDRRLVAASSATRSSARRACTPAMPLRRATSRSSSSWTVSSRCRRTCLSGRRRRSNGRGHHHWWCALLPHAGTWSDAKSYRQAMEQHVPLLAWSPAYGLGRGGVASYPDSNKPDRPATRRSAAGRHSPAGRRVAGRSDARQRRFVGDAAGPLRQARRAAAD